MQQSIGQQVDELRRKLTAALDARERAEQYAEDRRKAQGDAEKAHAVAISRAEQAGQTLAERSTARAEAAERLRHFVASGLLASALPGLELPEHWRSIRR